MIKKRILGLDIGISSIGWGVVDFENQTIRSGVKLFEAAEVPKTGASLNLARRTSRGQRRRLRRKRVRLKQIKDILNKLGLKQR